MRHLGFFKADSWITFLNWLSIPLIGLYLVSMFIVPVFSQSLDWKYIQSVWHNWQSLNVGMLAFLSSLIAFNISKANSERQRARDFIAARAFLPEALTSLTAYFRECSGVLQEAWSRASDLNDNCRTPLEHDLPLLPTPSYKQAFSQCISTSESDVGEHLAKILVLLQIHHSRLESMSLDFREGSTTIQIPHTIMSYIFGLGKLQALVNNTYEFARGEQQFKEVSLVIEDFQTAYFNLGINVEDIDGLTGFTQRTL